MVNVQPYEKTPSCFGAVTTVLQAYALRRHLLVWAEMDRQVWRQVWRVWRVGKWVCATARVRWGGGQSEACTCHGRAGTLRKGLRRRAAKQKAESSVSGGTCPVVDQYAATRQFATIIFVCALRSRNGDMGLPRPTAGAE